ncbi:alkaline phosphatase precursor [bacterium BMS3Abin04]|nr:alkaline phosphatase precursor [bacterium BMS3Abin04]
MLSKFRRDIFSYLIWIFILSSCKTQVENPFVKGPYLQDMKKTEMTIVWESDTTYTGTVFYDKGKNLNMTAKTNDAAKIQKVILKNLDPETEYTYKAEVNGYKSKEYTFRTAVKDSDPFTFAAYGDNKNGPFHHKKIVDLILSYHPLFVANNGDLVERGYVYEQWKKLFFDPAHDMMAEIPLVPAIGNHEENAEYYYNYFCLPENKAWYSFDVSDAHFVIVNTEEPFLFGSDEQINWLKRDLANNKSTWKFVFEHIPPFTSGGNYYSNERVRVKNLLHPIYEKYNVDMVISGHDHHYERSKPIGSKNSNHAVAYIVGGNGGTPMRYIGVRRQFSLVASRTFGFALISIDGKKMNFKEISINNKIIDEFTLDKNNLNSVSEYMKNKINFEDIKDPEKRLMKLYRSVGRKFYKKEKYSEAVKPLKKAFQLDNKCAEAAGTLALCYAKIGELTNAEKYAKVAIKIAPLFPYSYSAMAEVFKKRGKYDRAIEWYRKQIKIQPDSPNALEDIAGIYLEEGKLDSAIAAYQQAISVLPNEWELHFKLARLYEKPGKKKEALDEYKLAVQWFYDEKRSDDYLTSVEKIKELSK